MENRVLRFFLFYFLVISISTVSTYAQINERGRLEVTITPNREPTSTVSRQAGTDRGRDRPESNASNNASRNPNYDTGGLKPGQLVSNSSKSWEAQFKKQLQENTVEVGTYTLKSGNKYIDAGNGDIIRLPSSKYRANGSRAILNRVTIPTGYLYNLTIISGSDLARTDKVTEMIKKTVDYVLPEAIQAAIDGLGAGPAGPVEDQSYYDFTESGKYVSVRILYIR